MTEQDLLEDLHRDRVSSLGIDPPLSLQITETVGAAVELLAAKRHGCLLVLDGEALTGIFTERDFLMKALGRDLALDEPVSKIMTPEPATLSAKATVADAVSLMDAGGYRHVPILGKDGRPVGILSVKHISHYLVDHFPTAVYNLPPSPDQKQRAREGA